MSSPCHERRIDSKEPLQPTAAATTTTTPPPAAPAAAAATITTTTTTAAAATTGFPKPSFLYPQPRKPSGSRHVGTGTEIVLKVEEPTLRLRWTPCPQNPKP